MYSKEEENSYGLSGEEAKKLLIKYSKVVVGPGIPHTRLMLPEEEESELCCNESVVVVESSPGMEVVKIAIWPEVAANL